ncbi:MAG TPA: hypothetical protein DIW44_12930 [Anaerolineaceae bacterium]|nr:hypothetical protein [Anaerolineaceae bacterium]
MLKPESPLEKPKTIVIAGYFGFGNLGDELILVSMINGLWAQQNDLSIVVLSGNPKSTSKTHRVKSIAWEDYAGIVQAVSTCDLVILGGGGLFHDYWGVEPGTIFTSAHSGFSFYASVALLASIHQKKLMLSAIGVGPLFSDQARSLMRAIASQAIAISVRDSASQQLLISLGIPAHKITLTADAVFALPNIAPAILPGRNESPVLGVSLRHWDVGVDASKWQHEIALTLDHFLDAHPDGRVQFIPLQNNEDEFLDDFALAKNIQKALNNKARTSITPRNASNSDRLATVSQCDLFLGMRLHSIILALMNHIPIIGINYDPKVEMLLDQFGIENNLIVVGDIKSASLIKLLEQNRLNRPKFSSLIQKQTRRLAHLAQKNHELAVNLLQSETPNLPIQPETSAVLAQAALILSTGLDIAQKQILELQANNQSMAQHSKTLLTQKNEISSQYAALQNEFIAHQQKSDAEMTVLNDKYSSLEQKFSESHKSLNQINIKHANTINQLNQKQAELSHNLKELDSIKSSRGWKLLFKLWQLRLVFIPKDSKREAFIKALFQKKPRKNRQFLQKAARGVKRKLDPKLSWATYTFRNYQLKRHQLYPQKVFKLASTSTPGLVSIVLPVHNGERYVSAAIKSVLDQTYTNFELIIVDDGSSDATPSILREFEQKDNRIRVMRQSNLKLPGALNTGFASARGEFFTWTSDDNLLTPHFVEKMVACLHRHPSWHMVYANMDLIDEEGAPLRNSGWYEGYQFPHHSEHVHLPADPSELNIIPNNYIGGAFMYRRQVADLLAGYSPFQYTREDYDYWMQVNSLFTLRHTDFKEPVYKYRMHGASLTSQDAALKITEDRKFLMAFEDLRRDFNLMPLVWIFEDDQFDNPVVAQITAYLHDRGQICIEMSDFLRQVLPIKWIPCIHIKMCLTREEKETFLSTPQEYVYQVALFTSNVGSERPAFEVTLAVDQHVQILSESCAVMEEWIKAIDIKCRSLALRRIENQTWQPRHSTHKISVVICTYNRNELLELSIRAIARQTIPQSDYEVIIVDNNPDYSELIPFVTHYRKKEFFHHPQSLRLVQCPARGLSYARNAGISEANGEWVLFLDDDALAKPDLLEKYLEAIEKHPEAGLIGGHILLQRPEHLDMPWQPGWERYWSHFETDFKVYTQVTEWPQFPWGANWCARRQVLFQIGGFRSAYGRRGEDYSGGEEIIAASLIHKLGYSIAILPKAVVIHQVDPSRFSLQHLKHTILAGQLVRYQAELDQYLPRDLSLPVNPVQWMKKFFTRVIKGTNKGNNENQNRMIETGFLISAKRKLLRKHLLTECARFKFLYPLLKKLLY